MTSHVWSINLMSPEAQLDGHREPDELAASFWMELEQSLAAGNCQTSDFYLIKKQETAETPRRTQQVIWKRHLTMHRAVPAHFHHTITATFNTQKKFVMQLKTGPHLNILMIYMFLLQFV